MTVLDKGTLARWLLKAPKRSAIIYHVGSLSEDRWNYERGHARQPLDRIATTLAKQAERGRVRLYQKRIGPRCYAYIAVKTEGGK